MRIAIAGARSLPIVFRFLLILVVMSHLSHLTSAINLGLEDLPGCTLHLVGFQAADLPEKILQSNQGSNQLWTMSDIKHEAHGGAESSKSRGHAGFCDIHLHVEPDYTKYSLGWLAEKMPVRDAKTTALILIRSSSEASTQLPPAYLWLNLPMVFLFSIMGDGSLSRSWVCALCEEPGQVLQKNEKVMGSSVLQQYKAIGRQFHGRNVHVPNFTPLVARKIHETRCQSDFHPVLGFGHPNSQRSAYKTLCSAGFKVATFTVAAFNGSISDTEPIYSILIPKARTLMPSSSRTAPQEHLLTHQESRYVMYCEVRRVQVYEAGRGWVNVFDMRTWIYASICCVVVTLLCCVQIDKSGVKTAISVRKIKFYVGGLLVGSVFGRFYQVMLRDRALNSSTPDIPHPPASYMTTRELMQAGFRFQTAETDWIGAHADKLEPNLALIVNGEYASAILQYLRALNPMQSCHMLWEPLQSDSLVWTSFGGWLADEMREYSQKLMESGIFNFWRALDHWGTLWGFADYSYEMRPFLSPGQTPQQHRYLRLIMYAEVWPLICIGSCLLVLSVVVFGLELLIPWIKRCLGRFGRGGRKVAPLDGRPNEKLSNVPKEADIPFMGGIEDEINPHFLDMQIVVREYGKDKDHSSIDVGGGQVIDPDVIFHKFSDTTHDQLNRDMDLEALDRAFASSDDMIVGGFVPEVEANGLSVADLHPGTFDYDDVDGFESFSDLQHNPRSHGDADERISSGRGTEDHNSGSDED